MNEGTEFARPACPFGRGDTLSGGKKKITAEPRSTRVAYTIAGLSTRKESEGRLIGLID